MAGTVWRFVVVKPHRELRLRKGDVIVARPGRPTRVYRRFPNNMGLLINLHYDGVLEPIERFIGPEAQVTDAMENVDDFPEIDEVDDSVPLQLLK